MTASRSQTDDPRPDRQSLVVIKTRMPTRRAGLVRRTEIIRRLAAYPHRKVTLIQAPAGYGKSTVLLQWAESDPLRRFAWVTLEDGDNEPVLFWRYLILAIRTLSPDLGGRAVDIINSPQPDIDEVIRALLNSLLDAVGRLVLVLDDYHVIENPECHRSLQYFIDHLPDTMHVALGTRSRPPLALSKLEADGQMISLDADSLRFSMSESEKAIANSVGAASRDHVVRIHESCEGWPVGVYLSARRSEAHSLGDDEIGSRTVRSYITEQMLDELGAIDRSTLVTWSILPILNVGACNQVADRSDAALILEELSATNLLLQPVSADGTWYRFHDLLRDELRREFAQRPADEQRAARLSAMQWYLEAGETTEAIQQAIEASEFRRAAELICIDWLAYMLGGQLRTLRRWIDRIPAEAMNDYPPVLVTSAWIAAFDGDAAAAHRFEAAAQGATYTRQMPDGSSSYTAALEILQAGLGLRGMRDANEHAEHALRLEPPSSPWRGLTAALAGVTRFGLGRYGDARSALKEAARTPVAPDGVATYARGQLALIEMHEGRWEVGSRHADIGCTLIEESNLGYLVSSGAALVAAAAAAAHVGNRGLALQRLRSLAPIQNVLSDAIPFDAFQIHLIAAETYLVLGDHRAASVHAQSAASRLEAFGDAGVFEERLSHVQMALDSTAGGTDTQGALPTVLTDRELQILTMLQTDRSLREIGSELYISRNTVKTHTSSLYRKLSVTSRTSAVARARQLDLI